MNFKCFMLSIIVLSFILSSCNDKTTNPEPNNYESVTIGTQVWKAKNLDVDHYRNGDSIPEVRDPKQWANLTTGAWCYYDNDANNGKTYGKLYNWYAVNDPRGLAPEGWHIPSDEEWTTLSNYLGDESVAGDNLKKVGAKYWQSPSSRATNETGFSALPGGYREDREYKSIFRLGAWWSSSEYITDHALGRSLYYRYSSLGRIWNHNHVGFSVRCVKD